MNDLIALDFQGTTFSIVDHNGERWVTVKELAEALGYSEYRQLHKLIKRNEQEFTNKIAVVNLTTVENQTLTIINYHGVIRAAMLSNAPRAVEFRDWAETVLFEVMTKGSYAHPSSDVALFDRVATLMEKAMVPVVERINARFSEHDAKMQSLSDQIAAQHLRWQQTFIPANRDTSRWLTPTQRLRQLVSPNRLPKGFNQGGRFDLFAAERHHKITGSYPETRCRRHIQKRPEWIIEPCPETDDILRQAYRDYQRHDMKQRVLPFKFTPMPRIRPRTDH